MYLQESILCVCGAYQNNTHRGPRVLISKSSVSVKFICGGMVSAESTSYLLKYSYVSCNNFLVSDVVLPSCVASVEKHLGHSVVKIIIFLIKNFISIFVEGYTSVCEVRK